MKPKRKFRRKNPLRTKPVCGQICSGAGFFCPACSMQWDQGENRPKCPNRDGHHETRLT